ncbi:MAG: hypothetical protein A3F70_09740 [Acidobacteria bacterium RIFCSPLOWO2_12_FULL_67_14]|nr:MAG: hypothetical protein A3H29_00810 [Acidobacteria bacterium RIFCSPLOWO2_02_FULL_67_21]OFW38034.1 MAG: hypothetical protein A3F70_09740 [Acidobacteria bacterium RIFCSPLOWO2_12_FULL_67_14]
MGGTFGAAACVTVYVRPAIVNAPRRLVVVVFGAVSYVIVPDPTPFVPDVIVIQLTALVARQPHQVCVVTATFPVPPAAGNDWLADDNEKSHWYTNMLEAMLCVVPVADTAATRAMQRAFGAGQFVIFAVRSARIMPSACGEGFPMFTTRNGSAAEAW